jgi:replicative DNA helicase
VQAADDVRRIRTDRVPPHNLEAEESVLGAMLLSADAIADVVEIIQQADFYRSSNGLVFETIKGLFSRGVPSDAVTVVEELKRKDILEQIGGHLRISDLVERTPAPSAAASYARIVAETALMRRLIKAGSEVMEIGYSQPEDPERAADEAEQLVYDVARRDERSQVASLHSLIDDALIQLEKSQTRDSALAGVATGFRDVDRILSGLQKGNLIIIAARPAIGKSSFVTNVARNVAMDGRSAVAMFSLEMSKSEIGMRLLCSEARVPWESIRDRRVTADDWSRVTAAASAMHDAPLSIVDSGNVTLVDIRAKARRLSARPEGLDCIIVDYLQLMSHHRRVDNRQQEIAEISRGLKLLAKELDIPVIAVSQLNRDPERRTDKRPQLSDLRESGAIEQDADIVMFLHREYGDDPATKGTAELIIAKHRNGPTGKVPLTFLPKLTKFADQAAPQGAPFPN